MSDPVSSVKRFGVSLVGPKFEWAYMSGEEVIVSEYRAKHALSFEQLVEYNTMSAYIQAEATLSAKRLRERLEGVDEAEDPMARVKEITEQSNDEERRRWDMIIEQTLMLVADSCVDELREHMQDANPTDVRDLRDHLKRLVIDRIVPEVTEVARVDPTLPPPVSASPETEESGEPSASAE